MAGSGGSNKKIANSLVVLSSAAVLTVYAAGFTRTRAAADAFAAENSDTGGRRPPIPAPPARSTGERAAREPVDTAGSSPQLMASVQPPAAKMAEEKTAAAATATAPTSGAASTSTSTSGQTAAEQPKADAAPVTVAAATAAPAAAPAAPAVSLSAPPWKDGVWDAWGSCRHGDIQATVTIEGGKIKSAVISECATRYSCDIIDKLPPQVPVKQSENVDNVGGATQSANAFSYAVYYALAKAAAAAKGN